MKTTRREFMGVMGFTLGSTALFTSAGVLPMKNLIRPPGAGGEKEFLSKCLKCQQCINVCPEKSLRSGHLQDGFLASGTPILFQKCTLCLDCVKICPSGALNKNTTKENAHMAIAQVIPEECVGCDKCIPACEFQAITSLKEEKIVKIDSEKCKGCFSCIPACPVEPKGIKIVPLK